MSIEIIQVLVIIAIAVILFATEKLPVDLVAILIMGVLLLLRLIDPGEAVEGFSNPATVTVAGMFILSAGLYKTGIVERLGTRIMLVFKENFWVGFISMMFFSGILSAFINNTAIVALFLPVILTISKRLNISSSKLLIPLSFASMFGGVCTLIGTSTNILANSILVQHGLESFGMFEFSMLGLIFFGTGIVYMTTLGFRLLPDRGKQTDLAESFKLSDYVTEIVLLPDAESVGKRLTDSPLVKDLDIDVLEVIRDKSDKFIPGSDTVLHANDVLRVRTNLEKIKMLQNRVGVQLKPHYKWDIDELHADEIELVEAVVAPNSSLDGKTLKEVSFRNNFGATALAIRHRGTLMNENIGNTVLKAGDSLLIEIRKDKIDYLKSRNAFVVVSELSFPSFRKSKLLPAILIAASVVISATVGVFTIMESVILGCLLMVLTGCIKLDEAYRAIDWKVIFLLAGALSMGVAIEKSGTAELISNQVISSLGIWGPIAILSGFYITTSLLTESISNNATVVIMAPIAIVSSEALGINSKPLLLAIMFAASSSFMTPVGYQTNTLVYSAGQYKFTDFARVGAPLNLLFWIMATFLIPVFFPF